MPVPVVGGEGEEPIGVFLLGKGSVPSPLKNALLVKVLSPLFSPRRRLPQCWGVGGGHEPSVAGAEVMVPRTVYRQCVLTLPSLPHSCIGQQYLRHVLVVVVIVKYKFPHVEPSPATLYLWYPT